MEDLQAVDDGDSGKHPAPRQTDKERRGALRKWYCPTSLNSHQYVHVINNTFHLDDCQRKEFLNYASTGKLPDRLENMLKGKKRENARAYFRRKFRDVVG